MTWFRIKDLIDTLWNVKFVLLHIKDLTYYDLIDTLWNVKLQGALKNTSSSIGFNRYIVECKDAADAANV